MSSLYFWVIKIKEPTSSLGAKTVWSWEIWWFEKMLLIGFRLWQFYEGGNWLIDAIGTITAHAATCALSPPILQLPQVNWDRPAIGHKALAI